MELPSSAAAGIEAIDFQQLYLEEKRKAREARRQERKKQEAKDPAVKKTERDAVPPVDFPPWTLSLPSLNDVPILNRTRHCLSPVGIFYKQRFLSDFPEYQDALLDWLSQLPINKNTEQESSATGKWTVLPHANRRVALFDETIQPFPLPLKWLVDVLSLQIFLDDDQQHKPNHVLINQYTATQGIMPHTDGPAYHDRTATISLGSGNVLLHFSPNDNATSDDSINCTSRKQKYQVVLHGGGSLLVFEGEAYQDYKHSINELEKEVEHASDDCLNMPPGTAVLRDERISITVRHKKKNK